MQVSGPYCNFFLLVMDCGLKSKESRDSLTKVTGRTSIRYSRPSDLDLVDQIKVAYDLIWAAASESGGGATRRRRVPAAAHDRRKCSGAAGLRLGWGLAMEDARGTCSPPGVRVGFGEVRSMEFGGHGGSGRRGLAGAGGSVTPEGYGYQI